MSWDSSRTGRGRHDPTPLQTIDNTTHACPPRGAGGLMPCCRKTPWEVSRMDRITLQTDLVDCAPREQWLPDIPVGLILAT